LRGGLYGGFLSEVVRLDKIKKLLLSRTPKIDWEEVLNKYIIEADECNMILDRIGYFNKYREDEAIKNKKYSPFTTVFRKWEKDFKDGLDSYKGDKFYYPGRIIKNNQETYYSDDDAFIFLDQQLLNPEYKKNLEHIYIALYSLALKKAFYVLLQEKNPSLDMIVCLGEILDKMLVIVKNDWNEVAKKEKQRIINSYNASTTTNRIEKIKEHDKYPELDNLVKVYVESLQQKSMKTRREIDSLISKIVITNSPTTIRRYRRLIFEEYQNNKKAVSDTQK
jgi:hypothetical protein